DATVTGVQTCALPICRAPEITNVVNLPQLLEDRPRRVEVRGQRHACQDEQRTAIDGWRAADHRSLDQPGTVQVCPALQFMRDARSEERRVGKECRARR